MIESVISHDLILDERNVIHFPSNIRAKVFIRDIGLILKLEQQVYDSKGKAYTEISVKPKSLEYWRKVKDEV